MDTIMSYAGIIFPPIPKEFVPYTLLWLLVVIFGACTLVTSVSVKKLRKREFEQYKTIKEKDRQLERDDNLIEKLEYQVDRLTSIVEELDDDGNYTPP